MLSKSDEEILTERLRNWGRWAADSNRIGGASVLWKMMKLYGEREQPKGPDEQEPPKPIDGIDAAIVNRAWQTLPESPLRYHTAKWVLAAHYCYPKLTVFRFCQCMKIRKREYEDLLRLARYMIYNRIDQHAAKNLAAHSS